jgi:hypothetical protein
MTWLGLKYNRPVTTKALLRCKHCRKKLKKIRKLIALRSRIARELLGAKLSLKQCTEASRIAEELHVRSRDRLNCGRMAIYKKTNDRDRSMASAVLIGGKTITEVASEKKFSLTCVTKRLLRYCERSNPEVWASLTPGGRRPSLSTLRVNSVAWKL